MGKELIFNVEKATELWGNGLSYKGFDLCEWYSTNSILDKIYSAAGVGDTWTETSIYEDEDEDGEFISGTENVDCSLEGQECYLGYIPSKEIFISGFDMWLSRIGDYTDDYESEFKMVAFKIKADQNIEFVELKDITDLEADNLFYNSGYQKLQEIFKDVVDIRLD